MAGGSDDEEGGEWLFREEDEQDQGQQRFQEDVNPFSRMDFRRSDAASEAPTCVVCIEPLGMHGGPASLPCGHNGCLRCLQKVQKHYTSCPLCRTPFDSEMTLGPNLELKAALEQQKAAALVKYSPTKSGNSSLPPFTKSYNKVEQQQPELNFRNLLGGLVSIATRGITSRNKISDVPRAHHEASQQWNSIMLPSAPPMIGSIDDVRAMRVILEAEPPEWLPDSAAIACMQCSTSFRPLTGGRHHCRFCGGIFCRACSRGRCLMPARFRQREPQRVCDACYERLEPAQKIISDRVSNASQRATHDVTDLTCMRSWLNSPYGLSMEQEIYKATNTIRSYSVVGTLSPERGIPDAILAGACGVAIITVVKAGVMVTYKLGTGLVLAKLPDGTWSGPSAIATVGIGWGAQVGGELTDLLIVLRSMDAVKAFAGRLHLCFGAGLSATAGPVGRRAEADVRAGDGGTAACYTYSLSKGAFVGVSLEGSVVTRRGDTNARFYGDPYITSMDILTGVCPLPRAAAPLQQALGELFEGRSV